MSFSTLEFIIIFLPLFLVIYYVLFFVCKKNHLPANLWLAVGGLIFCLYADYEMHTYYNVSVALLEALLTYFVARGISYFDNKESYRFLRKAITVIGTGILLVTLIIYKYFVKALPIGISFYSFSMIAYLIDVYKHKVYAEKNVINYVSYILMFPRLVQGPITRYGRFRDSIRKRNINVRRIDKGLKLFILGLSFKVLIADKIGLLFFEIQKIGFESISTPLAWMGAVAYSLQLYFDFCGYSMMAVGIGNMLGFTLPGNFDSPYAARSIGEFYRRWHITLGQWFRDYIYIPLGGNRKGTVMTLFNLLLVWIATGIWHGRDLNFLIWAAVIFMFVALEKLFLLKILNKSRILSHVYVLVIIVTSWVIFALRDIDSLCVYLSRMFPFVTVEYDSNVMALDYIKYGRMYGPVAIVAVLLCIPGVYKRITLMRRKKYSPIICIVLFILCIHSISRGLSNPFMYYGF